ncbi:MAG: molybdenum ABC transporter ATP-binding protein [Muribaculaceae bacterium]
MKALINTINAQPIAVRFSNIEVCPLDALKGSKVYNLRQRINDGDKISRDEKNWIAEKLRESSFQGTSILLMGYVFEFSDIVKRYLVNQYGTWDEYYAPDKTSVRKLIYGRIFEIAEIK